MMFCLPQTFAQDSNPGSFTWHGRPCASDLLHLPLSASCMHCCLLGHSAPAIPQDSHIPDTSCTSTPCDPSTPAPSTREDPSLFLLLYICRTEFHCFTITLYLFAFNSIFTSSPKSILSLKMVSYTE